MTEIYNMNVVVPDQNVESFRNSFMYQDATLNAVCSVIQQS